MAISETTVTTKRCLQQIDGVHSLLDQTIHYYTYDRNLPQILRADLHWLDMADRVRYKLGVTVH